MPDFGHSQQKSCSFCGGDYVYRIDNTRRQSVDAGALGQRMAQHVTGKSP